MKKPTQPQAKKSKPKSPPRPLPQPQPNPSENLLLKVLQTWWGQVAALVAFAGAVQASFLTFDFFRTLYTDTIPEIHVAAQDTAPFSFPFTAKNNSHYFWMNNVSWKCKLIKLDNGINLRMSNIIYIRPGDPIAPTKQSLYACGVDLSQSLTNTKNLKIEMEASVSYKTLWFHRT